MSASSAQCLLRVSSVCPVGRFPAQPSEAPLECRQCTLKAARRHTAETGRRPERPVGQRQTDAPAVRENAAGVRRDCAWLWLVQGNSTRGQQAADSGSRLLASYYKCLLSPAVFTVPPLSKGTGDVTEALRTRSISEESLACVIYTCSKTLGTPFPFLRVARLVIGYRLAADRTS